MKAIIVSLTETSEQCIQLRANGPRVTITFVFGFYPMVEETGCSKDVCNQSTEFPRISQFANEYPQNISRLQFSLDYNFQWVYSFCELFPNSFRDAPRKKNQLPLETMKHGENHCTLIANCCAPHFPFPMANCRNFYEERSVTRSAAVTSFSESFEGHVWSE